MNMIESRKARAGQGGFTLIELLVVIAILAILSGAAIIGIGAMRTNARTQVCKTDMDTLATAAEAKLIDNPALTSAAVSGAAAKTLLDPYLKNEPASTATVAIAAGGIVTTGGC